MAILKSVVDVNNGNTGWTRSDVMDALETVFANLGYNGGTNTTGVPCAVLSPTGSRTTGYNTCARDLPAISYNHHDFDVSSIGTTAYRLLRRYSISTYTQSGPNSETDEINFNWDHELSTGDAIHWGVGETDNTKNLNGLTLDTVYYAIVVDSRKIKVAANATDAGNGVAIDLLYGNNWTNSAALGSSLTYFRDIDDAQYDNRTITIPTGDLVYFYLNDTSGGQLAFCGGTDSYDANKLLSDSTYRYFYNRQNSGSLASEPAASGTLGWNTYRWSQSEDERSVPDEQIPYVYRSNTEYSGTNNYGLYNYIYASDTHASMKGEIVVVPRRNSNHSTTHYYKYTVPASGGRSELKLRVHRYYSNFSPELIEIHSVGSGWTEGETFTIPGDQIGGSTPEDDIQFGVRTPETVSNANDGVCQILTTTLGAGSNLYQKSKTNGAFSVLKVVNDAAKNYGTSYYGIGLSNNNYDIYFSSGNHWSWMNRLGTNHTVDNGGREFGYFDGQAGLNRQNENYITSYDGNFTYFRFATTSTPTAYPMSIRVYRAQAPQDTNFAIIQFCQTINGIIVPYGTFSIHNGNTFGSSLWDLDNVFVGTMGVYDTTTRSVQTQYVVPGYHSSNTSRAGHEPVNANSLSRESAYGFFRDNSYASESAITKYSCNIDTDNNEQSNQIMTYYRNSTYDQIAGKSVDANADYYKPIKGLPVSHNMIPCPYYLPDDFVMLQFSTNPGATVFRPGDTVTVSASEIYEVMLAGYQTAQNGLDNVPNNSSIGMLFLARTT
tara:strand:+ start:133 stop:2457 length:2325 start_codon:yes stop_codon:yes gene_type:complete